MFNRLIRRMNPTDVYAAGLRAELGAVGAIFEKSDMEPPADLLGHFPQAIFMGAYELFAYRMSFLVDAAGVEMTEKVLVGSRVVPVDVEIEDWKVYEGELGEKVLLLCQPFRHDWSVTILTNSLPFSLALQRASVSPPAPWCVLREFDPGSLGSLQGDAEFYWQNYWRPFWAVASLGQKQRVLDEAPPPWREFIELHD